MTHYRDPRWEYFHMDTTNLALEAASEELENIGNDIDRVRKMIHEIRKWGKQVERS